MRRTMGLAIVLLASAALAQERGPTLDIDGLREEVAKLGPRLGAGSQWPDFVRRTNDRRPLVRLTVTNQSTLPLDVAAMRQCVRHTRAASRPPGSARTAVSVRLADRLPRASRRSGTSHGSGRAPIASTDQPDQGAQRADANQSAPMGRSAA